MTLKIRHIATRLALILTVAAVLPLVAYGVVSILSLQRGTRESVVNGNLNVAARAAEEIRRYLATHAEILKALAADLQNTGLEQWQQDRVVKNYVLQFREFREITLFDAAGAPVVTSRVGRPRVEIPRRPAATFDDVAMSQMRVDEDLLPTSVFALRLTRLNEPAGWLVGEFSLEQMWRMVDEIRIGSSGFALVVAPDGTLIAHGDPDKKALVAQSTNLTGKHPLVSPTAGGGRWREYVDQERRPQLAVAADIAALGWTVIVEQPTAEAYATAAALGRQLAAAISIALIAMVGVGLFFGRRFIAPIFTLQRATQAVAAGHLEARVDIRSADELGKLGEAFNSMADHLVALQEDVKRQERHAMAGRFAAGLFHDLFQPIQNIGNNALLLLRDTDREAREMSQRTIERDLATVRRFMEDLRNVSKPKPVERFPVDLNGCVSDVVDALRTEAERSGVSVDASYAAGPLMIEGDRFALGRVHRNLLTNAVQATGAGGRVTVTTRRVDGLVEIDITDTGVGIPADRLSAIFDDFVTTKRRGLGLGLAISKQIVEQLGGTISVRSEVGRGTSFTLRFPARDDLGAEAAAS